MKRTTAPDGRVYVSGPGLVTVLVDAADVDFMFSTAPAWNCGNRRLTGAVDTSSGYLVLASEGRPAVLTSIPAKADRPNPAVVALPVAPAGKFDRTAHAPRAHAGSVAPFST